MSEMDDIHERLDEHENRIRSLEDTRADTLKALSDMDSKHELRLRDTKQGLENQINDLKQYSKERDDANARHMNRLESKFDRFSVRLEDINKSFAKAIRQTPPWVWPLISVILAVAGWFIGKRG